MLKCSTASLLSRQSVKQHTKTLYFHFHAARVLQPLRELKKRFHACRAREVSRETWKNLQYATMYVKPCCVSLDAFREFRRAVRKKGVKKKEKRKEKKEVAPGIARTATLPQETRCFRRYSNVNSKEEEDCHAAGNLAPRSANWDRSDRPNRRDPAFLFSSMDASSWIIIRNNSESYMTAARETGRHVVITKTEMTVWLFRRLIRNCAKVIAVCTNVASRRNYATVTMYVCKVVSNDRM